MSCGFSRNREEKVDCSGYDYIEQNVGNTISRSGEDLFRAVEQRHARGKIVLKVA